MNIYQDSLTVQTRGKGTYEITGQLQSALNQASLQYGLLTVFCRHTSCSLLLMENADPSARHDLEKFFDRMVPENDHHFTHTLEGADDMPSHIRMALTRSSESIPFQQGNLLLGTWQGCFLFEHRRAPHTRSLHLTLLGQK